MSRKIVVLPGDGVGPEVTAETVRLLGIVSERYGLDLAFAEALIGGAGYDAAGSPLPHATIAACKSSTAVLLGPLFRLLSSAAGGSPARRASSRAGTSACPRPRSGSARRTGRSADRKSVV